MILRGVKTPEPLGEGELQHVKELCLGGKSADRKSTRLNSSH